MVNAETFRKSAEIVNHPEKAVAALRRATRDGIKDLLRSAFPAQSLNQMCEDGARGLGESADTIYRLFHNHVSKQDLGVLAVIAGIYFLRTQKHHPLGTAILSIVNGRHP